jgi:hypothetical protein
MYKNGNAGYIIQDNEQKEIFHYPEHFVIVKAINQKIAVSTVSYLEFLTWEGEKNGKIEYPTDCSKSGYKQMDNKNIIIGCINEDFLHLICVDHCGNQIWRTNDPEPGNTWITIYKDLLFLDNHEYGTLSVYSLVNGTRLWQVDFRKELNNDTVLIQGGGGPENRLVLMGNTLYVDVTTPYDYRHPENFVCGLFFIDIYTGKILNKVKGFGGLMYGCNNKLYLISHQQIRMMDVNTCEITEKQLTRGPFAEGEKQWDIEYERSVIYDGLLYFTARPGQVLNSILGIMDLNTYEVLWYHELLHNPKKKPSNQNRCGVFKIYVNDRIIAASCGARTLHIFDRNR